MNYVNEAVAVNGRRKMLHYWYLDECMDCGEKFIIAHGVVTGHNNLPDSYEIHTSKVKNVVVNHGTEEAEIYTMNSIYYCPLEYCDFMKQDKAPHIIPNYKQIKEQYQNKRKDPSIEEDKVLLVISNFSEYYFDSLYYLPQGEKEIAEYNAYPHIGTFQDSYLIRTKNGQVDIRYFPHWQNIEFYAMHTGGKPVYIENIGDATLYAKCPCGILRLNPGERKEVRKENAEKEDVVLCGGDLYPTMYL